MIPFNKILLVFSHVCKFAVFWCFAAGQNGNGCIVFMHCNICNWHVNAYTLKLATRLLCLCSTLKKCVIVFGFLRFSLSYILHASQPIRQPSALNDRYRTLVPTTNNDSFFKIKINTSLKYLLLLAYAKNFAEFPFLYMLSIVS